MDPIKENVKYAEITPRISRFDDYQHEALVTASMGKGRVIEGFVRVCGLVGEAAELRDELISGFTGPSEYWGRNIDKIKKELGDVLWYAATLSEWLGLGVHFTFDSIQGAAMGRTFDGAYVDLIGARGGKLAELMKKHLGHDKPMADFKGREVELMWEVFLSIAHVANTVGLDLGEVAALNIAKLRLRHNGGGFTTAAQNAKADEKECNGTLVHSEYSTCPKCDR